MGFPGNFVKWYKAWRHSRGYGIHSPFAYSLVREAINPGRGYGWYGYEAIDVAMHSGLSQRDWIEARLLLRTGAFLDADIYSDKPLAGLMKTAADALSGMKFKANADAIANLQRNKLYVAFSPDGIEEKLANGEAVIAFRPSAQVREKVMSFSGRGLLLYGKKGVLAVPNQSMAFTCYEMRF